MGLVKQFFCSFEGLQVSAKHSLQREICSFIRTADVVERWTEGRNFWMLPAVLPVSTTGKHLFKHSYQSRVTISYTPPYITCTTQGHQEDNKSLIPVLGS